MSECVLGKELKVVVVDVVLVVLGLEILGVISCTKFGVFKVPFEAKELRWSQSLYKLFKQFKVPYVLAGMRKLTNYL